MKYLLDTNVWLWSLDDPANRLNSSAREIIENAEADIYLSSVSTWELSIKMRLGKLRFPAPPSQTVSVFMARQRLNSVAITHIHAAKIYDLPLYHADPFDRMLIAQALVEEMTLLTSDRIFEKYPVEIVWAGS
jgi:PIN domain nuclease of toxin-antitoxin system